MNTVQGKKTRGGTNSGLSVENKRVSRENAV
jgi:hypothetical protein